MSNREPGSERSRLPSVAEAIFAGGLVLGPIALSNPGSQTGLEVLGFGSLIASAVSAAGIYMHDRGAHAPSDSEDI